MSAKAGVVRAISIAVSMALSFIPVTSPSESEMREYGDKPQRWVNARVVELVAKPWLTINGRRSFHGLPPSGDLTTDNTVAEIKAARDTALGIELDRHLCVQFSDNGPPLRQPRRFIESRSRFPMLSLRPSVR